MTGNQLLSAAPVGRPYHYNSSSRIPANFTIALWSPLLRSWLPWTGTEIRVFCPAVTKM